VRRQNNGNVVRKIPNIFFFSPHSLSLHYNFLFIQKALVRSDKEERKIIQAAASVNFLI